MQILSGKPISDSLRKSILRRSESLISKGVEPKMIVILIGNHLPSEIYVKHKEKFCNDTKIECEVLRFSESIKESELIDKIKQINEDSKVHGLIVQLPIPDHISQAKVIQSISPKKDVDGFTFKNLGKTFIEEKNALLPATPAGVLKILDNHSLSVKGKHCVVIGHSIIVGKPLAVLLLSRDATVSVCNIFTEDISEFTKKADFIFTAVGKANLITKDMVKDGFVGVDIGISRDENGKISGDLNFEGLKEKASYLTPVPGGVGVVTVATLCENVVKAAEGF